MLLSLDTSSLAPTSYRIYSYIQFWWSIFPFCNQKSTISHAASRPILRRRLSDREHNFLKIQVSENPSPAIRANANAHTHTLSKSLQSNIVRTLTTIVRRVVAAPDVVTLPPPPRPTLKTTIVAGSLAKHLWRSASVEPLSRWDAHLYLPSSERRIFSQFCCVCSVWLRVCALTSRRSIPTHPHLFPNIALVRPHSVNHTCVVASQIALVRVAVVSFPRN